MLLYVFDLFGVAVFAASGALAGIAAGLGLLGVLVLASITAVGGGTLRDVLLGRHPIFWIRDSVPLYTIIAATAATVAWVHYLPVPMDALLVADASPTDAGKSVDAFAQKPFEGEAFDRMRADPELARAGRRLLYGAVTVGAMIVIVSAWSLLSGWGVVRRVQPKAVTSEQVAVTATPVHPGQHLPPMLSRPLDFEESVKARRLEMAKAAEDSPGEE